MSEGPLQPSLMNGFVSIDQAVVYGHVVNCIEGGLNEDWAVSPQMTSDGNSYTNGIIIEGPVSTKRFLVVLLELDA